MPSKPAKSKSIDGLSRATRKKPVAKKTSTAKPTAAKIIDIKGDEPEIRDEVAEVIAETETPETAETPEAETTTTDTETQPADTDDISGEIAELEQAESLNTDQESIPAAKDKKSGKQVKRRNKNTTIIGIILLLAEAVAGGLFYWALLRLKVLHEWQNIAVLAVMILLFALTAWKLLKKRAMIGTRIAFAILAVILATGYGFGFYYIHTTVGFLQNITMVSNTELQEYSVAVYKDSGIKDLAKLSGKKIGFQKTNLHLKETESKLKENLKYTSEEYADLASMFVGMDDGTISAIVVATSYLDVLKDDAEEYYKRLKVIHTFDIEIEKEEKKTSNIDVQNQPFIIYISGTDSRNGVKATARSDVNMLAVVNPKKNKILLVSVPRDYYVQLHGTTGNKDKLTHAGIYGIDMSKNTMSDIFGGVDIAHTVKVSFTTVEKLVDAVDGIDIDSDQGFTAYTDRSCRITKGMNHLGGKCALAFARERYAYSSGDRHRVQNQQAVLTAIFKKATTIQYIVNYPRLLSAVEGTFQTSLSYDEITDFAKMQLNTMKSWEIESINVDGTGSSQPTYSMGSQLLYVMIPNQQTVDDATKKIQEYLK